MYHWYLIQCPWVIGLQDNYWQLQKNTVRLERILGIDIRSGPWTISVREIFQRWVIDIVGPLKETSRGNKYVIVATALTVNISIQCQWYCMENTQIALNTTSHTVLNCYLAVRISSFVQSLSITVVYYRCEQRERIDMFRTATFESHGSWSLSRAVCKLL